MSWRKNLNKSIRPYVEKLIRTSFLYKKGYSKADDKGKAQLWVALALLSKQLSEIELKLKLFEGVLKEISPKKVIKLKESKAAEKTRDEVELIVRQIASGKPVMPARQPQKHLPKQKQQNRKNKKITPEKKKKKSKK